MKKRNEIIDFLRALAIIVMIFLHTTAKYIDKKGIYPIWDWAHFAVPIFVFCSGYLFFKKNVNVETVHEPSLQKGKEFISFVYVKNRLVRILAPYFIFLIFFFPIIAKYEPHKINFKYISSSILLTGGVEINWLVLLFVYLTLLLPILHFLILKRYRLFIIHSLLSVTSTIYLLVWKLEIENWKFNYLIYMWLPWSTILIYCYYFTRNENNKKFFYINITIGLIVFISSYLFRINNHMTVSLFNNKYPPNIYYLSYGWTIMNIIYLFFPRSLFKNNVFNKIVYFISKNSYSIFFIHWILIYILAINGFHFRYTWPLFFTVILTLTIVVQLIFNYITKKIATSGQGKTHNDKKR